MEPLTFAGISEGQELESLQKPPIDRVQLVKYAGASGDFNPLHTVDDFARQAGLEGVIAHGMLSMGFLGHYLRTLIGVNADIKQFKVRFGQMAKPGDVLTCKGCVKDKEEKAEGRFASLELRAENQRGEVITSGSCQVRFF